MLTVTVQISEEHLKCQKSLARLNPVGQAWQSIQNGLSLCGNQIQFESVPSVFQQVYRYYISWIMLCLRIPKRCTSLKELEETSKNQNVDFFADLNQNRTLQEKEYQQPIHLEYEKDSISSNDQSESGQFVAY